MSNSSEKFDTFTATDLEEIDRRERAVRLAYSPVNSEYDGDCNNCDRSRVELCNNGKMICQKCHWDQKEQIYDGTHRELFG